jgi:hypothetical protein
MGKGYHETSVFSTEFSRPLSKLERNGIRRNPFQSEESTKTNGIPHHVKL